MNISYIRSLRINQAFNLLSLILLSSLLPISQSQAGLIDEVKTTVNSINTKVTNVGTNVTTVKTNVGSLIGTIQDAKDTIADQKLKNMIIDVKSLIKTAVETQQEGYQDFIMNGNCTEFDGTPCGIFKLKLTNFFESLIAINNTALKFNDIPNFNLNINDPGIVKLISILPPRMLFPAYKVMSKTNLLDPTLITTLENIDSKIETMRSIMYGDIDLPPLELDMCKTIDENTEAVSKTASSVAGIGVLAKIVGAIFEAMSKTTIAGPVEVDVGIHGYVHGTIHQNTPHAIGKIVSGIGTVLSSASSFTFNKIKFCGIQLRQENILANQAQLLLGQTQIMCTLNPTYLDTCPDVIDIGMPSNGKGKALGIRVGIGLGNQ